MTTQDLMHFTWVPAVAIIIWHLHVINKTIKPQPKLCRHEFQLIGNSSLHVSTYRCYSCHKIENLDHRVELAKRYPNKADQS